MNTFEEVLDQVSELPLERMPRRFEQHKVVDKGAFSLL